MQNSEVVKDMARNPGATMQGGEDATWAVKAGMELKHHHYHMDGNGSRPSTTPNDTYDPSSLAAGIGGDLPVKNVGRLDINSGMTYGGGFQINSPEKIKKPPLRGLDQKSFLPDVTEVKNMVEGSDGRFYLAEKDFNAGDGNPQAEA